MSEAARLREEIAEAGHRMVSLGLTHGATGNISARLSDGTALITPTGVSLGRIDPAQICHLDASGGYLSGAKPTKELPLHQAFYETRGARTGAVVHLHSTHSVGLSVLPDVDPDDVLPPITAYSVMQLGRVKLVPYYRPGDPEMGNAIRGLAGRRSAVLLANHGPVIAGKDLMAACNAMEELEATARLVFLTRGMQPRLLTGDQVTDLVRHFNVEWDA